MKLYCIYILLLLNVTRINSENFSINNLPYKKICKPFSFFVTGHILMEV